MPVSSFLRIVHAGNALESKVKIVDREGLTELFAFDHRVELGEGDTWGGEDQRVHRDLKFLKTIDNLSPILYQVLTQGDVLDEVEVRWYRYHPQEKKLQDYFCHKLENAKVVRVREMLPKVKDPELDMQKSLEEVHLRYQRVTWHHLDGNILFQDEWNQSMSQPGSGDGDDLVEDVMAPETTTASDQPVKKVRLFEGAFGKPEEGYQFNQPCPVSVKAELPEDCTRKKVTFSLFSEYEGEVQDMNYKAEGVLKDGIAQAELKLFQNKAYYRESKNNPEAKVMYFFKASHPDASESLESEKLEMPQMKRKKAGFVETPDVLFNTNSAVPCLDSEGTLIGVLLTTLKYASDNPGKEMVVFGHTDTSGEIAYNHDLSELRAKAVKALLDGDDGAWSSVTKKQSKVIDYQTILKTLTDTHGWSCDPGTPDDKPGPKTKSGVENFQSEYNQKFQGNLAVDGAIGPKTWGAILDVVLRLVKDAYDGEFPKLNYGFGGKGLYPCGESFPIEGKGKDEHVSKTNRRVEAIFWDKDNPPGLKEHKDKNTRVTSEECSVYDDQDWDKIIIKPEKPGTPKTPGKLPEYDPGEPEECEEGCGGEYPELEGGDDLEIEFPILIAESDKQPGLNADGSPARDMTFGDLSSDQIKKLHPMFAFDDFAKDLDTVSADALFSDFRKMAKDLFSIGELEKNITAMIDKFESKSGGEYSNDILTKKVGEHESTKRFVDDIHEKIHSALNGNKGDINQLEENHIDLEGNPRFNTKRDIIFGLTIALNDIWAYQVEVIEYELVGKNYNGTFKLTLYDHFGLDAADVDWENKDGNNSPVYGTLAGFRAWFILQHLNRFAYKPFVTVIELNYPFSGEID